MPPQSTNDQPDKKAEPVSVPPQFSTADLKMPEEALHSRTSKRKTGSLKTTLLVFIIFFLLVAVGVVIFWAYSTGLFKVNLGFSSSPESEVITGESEDNSVTLPAPLPPEREKKPAFKIVPGQPRPIDNPASSTATTTADETETATSTPPEETATGSSSESSS